MKTRLLEKHPKTAITEDENQKGSAIVIALFVLVLLSAFVALAMSRTASEAAAIGNDAAEAKTTYAAQGSLEMMTRNFNKLFEVKLNPSRADIDAIQLSEEPGLINQYSFVREVDPISDSKPVVFAARRTVCRSLCNS